MDEHDLLNDDWDTAFSKTKLTTFSTTRDTVQERETAYDSGDESEGLGDDDMEDQQDDEQFMFEDVEFDMDQRFTKVVASQNSLFFTTEMGDVAQLDLSQEQPRYLTLEKTGAKVEGTFVDPTGCHLLISMENGENYYFNSVNMKKPKKLRQFNNMVIKSVAWDNHNKKKSESTGVILLGTKDSCIFETVLENTKDSVKYLKLLFNMKDCSDILVKTGPITGLRYEYFPKSKSQQTDTFLVFAISPFRCYEFVGGPTFEELFAVYKNRNILTYKELPESSGGELHLFRSSLDRAADSFAWLSKSVLLHGSLVYNRRKPGDSAIRESEIIQFDSKSSVVSIAITEFHIIVAHPDKIQIYMQPPGLCSPVSDPDASDIAQVPISELKIVYQEHFSQNRGKLLGLTVDEQTGTIYAYTNSSVHKLMIDNEERDVWRLYLAQALDPKSSKEELFDIALRLCKPDAKTRDIVLTAKADYYFRMGQYRNAANIYAKTTKSFEEVAIAFSTKDQQDALRVFLLNKLKSVLSKVTKENDEATQLSCLCTWLTEIYLAKINELYDEGDLRKTECEAMKNEFKIFLESNRKHLNRETTFNLISSHGQVQEALYYAMLIEDYERVISHCINEGDYAAALKILNKFCKPDESQYEEYFYKFAPVLMQHLPKEMVSLLTKRRLNPGRLIPALMRHIAISRTDSDENHVIRYLEWCVKQNNQDPAIHNLLLSLYANLDDDSKLLLFLNTEGEFNFYDPKYALRICTEKGKTEACVRLYGSMGLYEDAVDLALSMGEIKLARECADKPEDDDSKKKLWLRIAKHVIEKEQNVKNAIEFLSFTDKIKLEDILPFFPDFVLIDDFKEEICKSLEEYKNDIESLKNEMQDATQNANLIREDIKELKHRYGYITANAKCDATNCAKSVLAKDFYLFPCQHMLHMDCLIEEILKHVSATKAEKIVKLNAKRKKLIESGQLSSMSSANQASDIDQLSNPVMSSATAAKDDMKELDDLISSECPYCGDIMINSIDTPFVTENDSEFDSWSLRSLRMSSLDDE